MWCLIIAVNYHLLMQSCFLKFACYPTYSAVIRPRPRDLDILTCCLASQSNFLTALADEQDLLVDEENARTWSMD